MKRSILVAIFSIIIILSCEGNCQHYWKYPITPATKEWKDLKTLHEIISVQQIPDNILKKMTTDEVYQAWLDLPGKMDILAFNSMQEGFNVVKKRFNVVSELLIRQDIGTVVFKRYLLQNPNDLKKCSDSYSKGKLITDFGLNELLLSQPEVLTRLTNLQKKNLFELIKQNLNIKKNQSQKDQDFFWINSSLVLVGRILEKESLSFQKAIKSKKDTNESLKTGELRTKENIEFMIKTLNESSL
jgi:hypothetical protein